MGVGTWEDHISGSPGGSNNFSSLALLTLRKSRIPNASKEDPHITWDREKDMGLNFDLTVEKGKVAFEVSLIKPCKQRWTQKSRKPFTKKKKKNIKKALFVIIDSRNVTPIFLSSYFLCRTHRFNVLLGMYWA